MEMSGPIHPPHPLYSRGKNPLSMEKLEGWTRSRSERLLKEKSLAATENRTSDRRFNHDAIPLPVV
jgi:hypothetical protein